MNDVGEREAGGREGRRTCWAASYSRRVCADAAFGAARSAVVPSRARARVTDAFNARRVARSLVAFVLHRPPPRLRLRSVSARRRASSLPPYGVLWATQHDGSARRPLWKCAVQSTCTLHRQETCPWPWTNVSRGPRNPRTLSYASTVKSEAVTHAITECKPAPSERK